MYGVLYNNDYNDRIGQIVKAGEFSNALSTTDLQPSRLVGGSLGMRYIGGASEMREDNEPNAYRPRGAVYVGHSPSPRYIVPYSIVNYPQFNAVELADVDRLKSGLHPSMSAGCYCQAEAEAEDDDDMSGGKIKISKKVKRDFKRVGRVLKPVGKELLKVGKEIATELGKQALQKGKEMALDYIESNTMQGQGIKKDMKKVGRQIKKALTSKDAKKFYKSAARGALDIVQPIASLAVSKYVPEPIADVLTETGTEVIKRKIGRGRPRKVAGVGIYEGAGVKSGGASSGGASSGAGAKSGGAKSGAGAKSGGADKRKARGNLIKKLMKEKGMKLGEASKYIKDNNLI